MSRMKNYPPFYNALRFSPGIKKGKITNIVEENNNEINTLTEKFETMGNITGNPSKNKKKQDKEPKEPVKQESKCDEDYDYDFDEFEEENDEEKTEIEVIENNNLNIEKRDIEEKETQVIPISENVENEKREPEKHVKMRENDQNIPKNTVETPKKTPITSRASSRASCSQCSSISRSRRLNMSFTNDRAKDIDRENRILLKKILRTKTSISSLNQTTPRVCSATVTRRRADEKIQHDNLILLKKIQNVKSSNLSWRRR